jgi:tetraacyldisaccharide 4'-kinase
MRAPAFWFAQKPGVLAHVLRPIGAVYGAITARRMASAGAVSSVPVICVGNFSVGGAGKTPAALSLARLLKNQGETVYFLSRGHGGRRHGSEPLLVDPLRHTATMVGDEPLLLARLAPTVISRDRLAGAHVAARLGASVIIMDDGMQNPSIAKHLVLAVVDGRTGIGNGLCFPAGPLRAPLASQLPFAHALIMIGDMAAGRSVAAIAQLCSKPVLRAQLVPDPAAEASLGGRRVFAFAGIADPEKFFRTVEQCGAVLVGRRSFSDHHPFTNADCRQLSQAAANARALLITTEKDLVRLPKGFQAIALPVSLAFANERQVTRLVTQALQQR